ncbi:MBL fold metallo-hydrolase [Oceanobacillus saliphilus]|uniref:MBL fold metallo-hydrolase n=1 Tax=Oceanobacillus saliphilus TaxID=2925834 RepID=UPI00201E2100
MSYLGKHVKIIPIEVPVSNKLKSINFFIVKKQDSLFLIDAGLNNESYWNYLQQTLCENGYTLNNLTAILLTHHHFDHVGLVHQIANKHGIPVYIHPYALPKLKLDPEFMYMSYTFFKDLYRKMDCGEFGEAQAEDRYRKQMSTRTTASDWNVHEICKPSVFGFEIIPIPGHAPDQVAFYIADEKILFIGDLLIEHMASCAIVEPELEGSRSKSLIDHQKSLKAIIALSPRLAYSGHGSVIHNPAQLAEKRLKEIESKAKAFLALIESGISTGSEIVKQEHPAKYEKQFFTVMSEVMSFLDYLEVQGEIIKEEKAGVWHYSSKHTLLKKSPSIK